MKKILNYISIIMFFSVTVMIGISAVFFQHNASLKSIYEETGSAAATAKAYLQQNFPFRRNWESLYSRTAEIMGKREFGDIYLDSDNERLIRVFSEYDEEQLDENVSAVNAFRKRHSRVSSYIMLAPTASGIYREELPDSIGAIDQQKLIDDIYYDIDAEVTPLDVFNAIYSARDNYVYFRTDPYWTQQGAYEAYSAAVSKLGAQPYTIANYDVDYTRVYYMGELSQQCSVRSVSSDTINAYRCKYGSYIRSTKLLRDKQTYTKTSVYSMSGLQSDNKYAYFLGANNFKCAQIETTNEDKPSLLMIKSDYANCFVPFLAPHYSHITMIDPDMLDDGEVLEDFADPEEYDQILFLYDVESFCKSDGLEKLTDVSDRS